MKLQSRISLLLSVVFLLNNSVALAFETDQYNLPPVRLADIGDEVSEYVADNLITAVATVNADISARKLCLESTSPNPKGCGPMSEESKKITYLRSNDAIAAEISRLLAGNGLMTTKFGGWIYAHKFSRQPDRYKTGYGESIFLLNPADYLTISPTVRLYGVEFGIDKLEHFFQQGHQYYEIERKALASGAAPAKAVQKAVEWGKKTERTYYGLLASGVYSNADLYANYAGMKFYQGLTRALQINGRTRPATLYLRDGSWNIDPATLRENLLKPFLTDHMNEALNPSAFRLTLVRSVRRAVKKYSCPDWLAAYPTLTAVDISGRSKALELWHGEDYGHTKKSHTVRIADECFDLSS